MLTHIIAPFSQHFFICPNVFYQNVAFVTQGGLLGCYELSYFLRSNRNASPAIHVELSRLIRSGLLLAHQNIQALQRFYDNVIARKQAEKLDLHDRRVVASMFDTHSFLVNEGPKEKRETDVGQSRINYAADVQHKVSGFGLAMSVAVVAIEKFVKEEVQEVKNGLAFTPIDYTKMSINTTLNVDSSKVQNPIIVQPRTDEVARNFSASASLLTASSNALSVGSPQLSGFTSTMNYASPARGLTFTL